MDQLLQHYSYIGLFGIIFIEEAGIPLPIPGDLFIAASAALPGSNYIYIVASTVIATLLGSTILFTLSRKFGNKLILKLGKYIGFTQKKYDRVEHWFEKHGGLAISIGRLTPGFRTLTSIVCGSFEVDYKTFWIYTALAAFVWANIFFAVGKFFNSIYLVIKAQFGA